MGGGPPVTPGSRRSPSHTVNSALHNVTYIILFMPLWLHSALLIGLGRIALALALRHTLSARCLPALGARPSSADSSLWR